MIGAHGMPREYLKIQKQSIAVTLNIRRSDVYGGMYLYVCLKYFVLIIWWLTIFNKCIFDVANVGRSSIEMASIEMASIDSLLWLGLNDTPY